MRSSVPGNRSGRWAPLDAIVESVPDALLGSQVEWCTAALQKMNTAEHQFVGPLLHDRIIAALELCRRGEMLMIQNKRVNWETCQIGIPGATAKDKENRRIPFNPKGRIAAILERRAALGSDAFVFGSASGAHHGTRLPSRRASWRHRASCVASEVLILAPRPAIPSSARQSPPSDPAQLPPPYAGGPTSRILADEFGGRDYSDEVRGVRDSHRV